MSHPSINPKPMKLNELLASANIEVVSIEGQQDRLVTDVCQNSSRTIADCAFVAIKGTQSDGHFYLSDAVDRGARTIFVDREIKHYPGTTLVRVASTRDAFGKLSHALFGHPARSMEMAGVTGTNGKTSTTWILNAILESVGKKSAVIGTLGTITGEEQLFLTGNTTPDARTLAEHLAVLAQMGTDSVVMEASSHGLDQERITGLLFDTAALTNITRDHLDYHNSFEEYVLAKKLLFDRYLKTDGHAILNMDDPSGESISGELIQPVTFFGRKNTADITISKITHHPGRTGFVLDICGEKITGSFPLPGDFSVANAAAAAGMALGLGLKPKEIEAGLQFVKSVPGRFEPVEGFQPFLVAVDYAHTPDALEQTLQTARRLTAGRLICVYGCGGDRDQVKRPLMSKAVERYTDYAVLTSDNPRNEDPLEIIRDMKTGIKRMRHDVILDRGLAIEKALYAAQPGDTVMICGKGHEDYQELLGHRVDFCDRQYAREILRSMGHLSASKPALSPEVDASIVENTPSNDSPSGDDAS